MSKKILLVNDLAGYGKVALSAMIPVLSHMGCETYNLQLPLYPIHWIMGNLKFWTHRNI